MTLGAPVAEPDEVRALLRRLVSEERPFVVWDTEFTCWPGSVARDWSGEGEHRELVQIAAVRVAPSFAEPWREVACFDRLVLPRVNPVLSDYFTELTGISNEWLSRHGEMSEVVIDAFVDWIGDDSALCNGVDPDVLAETTSLHGLSPVSCSGFVNIEGFLSVALGNGRKVQSHAAASAAGEARSGRAHYALDDARSVARAIERIVGF